MHQPARQGLHVQRSSSNSSFVIGVMGLTSSLYDFDFSRRFDGEVSISRLGVLRFISGERVTTVALRFRDGVSGTASALVLARPGCSSPMYDRECSMSLSCDTRLGISDGMVGRLCSAKFIVLRNDGLGSGDAEADSVLRSNTPDSYSFTNIWFAAMILRGMRFARAERLV